MTTLLKKISKQNIPTLNKVKYNLKIRNNTFLMIAEIKNKFKKNWQIVKCAYNEK